MSQQFPNHTPEDSEAAWDDLLRVLDGVKDNRVYLWLATWAKEAAQKRIVETEAELMRREHFGYDEDAAKSRDSLRAYEEANRVATFLEGWLRLLVIEKDVAQMFAGMRSGRRAKAPKKLTQER